MATYYNPKIVTNGLVMCLDAANPKSFPSIPYYSVSFNGTTQYCTIPNTSALVFGTGDYTMECWIYQTVATSRIFIAGTVGGNFFAFLVNSSAKLISGRVGADEVISTNSVSLNKWVHVAATRQSNTARIFIDGNLEGSATVTTNYGAPSTVNYIGSDTSNYLNGYISNFRVVKGTALYTANFTPPASPLGAITNTSLLTCHSTVISDGSTNNFTITNNGSPTVVQNNPFSATSSAWNDLSNNGNNSKLSGSSVPLFAANQYFIFNGTSNYAAVPDTTQLRFSGDFSMAAWCYATSVPSSDTRIISKDYAVSSPYISYGLNASSSIANGNLAMELGTVTGNSAAGLYNLSANEKLPLNTWRYIVGTLNASTGTAKIYVNGVLKNTGTGTGGKINYYSNWNFNVGGLPERTGYYFPGYISQAKLYNVELSNDEILQNYNAARTRFGL